MDRFWALLQPPAVVGLPGRISRAILRATRGNTSYSARLADRGTIVVSFGEGPKDAKHSRHIELDVADIVGNLLLSDENFCAPAAWDESTLTLVVSLRACLPVDPGTWSVSLRPTDLGARLGQAGP